MRADSFAGKVVVALRRESPAPPRDRDGVSGVLGPVVLALRRTDGAAGEQPADEPDEEAEPPRRRERAAVPEPPRRDEPAEEPPPAQRRPADEDSGYRAQNLKFTGVELALSESVSARTMLRLWLYAAAAAGLVVFLFAFFALVAAIGGASPAAAAVLVDIGVPLSFVAFWVVLLLVKIDEPVSEWKTLIEGKAAAADSSYAAIYRSLARRRIPVGVTALRIRSDLLAESVNNRLIIMDRSYVAHVSVFAFGTSLYVGWMMWRSRRGVTLLVRFVKDLVAGLLGRTGPVDQMLRSERVRAMREAVHAAVREGVDAAVEDVDVPIAGIFGEDIPVESDSIATPESAGQTAGPPTVG